MALVKPIIGILALILVLSIGYYLIGPAFKVVELNEPLINDNLNRMDRDEMREFNDAVDAMQNESTQADEPMIASSITARGMFKPRAHDVEGEAKLITTSNGTILRFENFDTINGPDLHVYLSSELGNSDFIDLGTLKANRGNFNYKIDENIDTQKYNIVLVWCVPFGVLFSYAELIPQN